MTSVLVAAWLVWPGRPPTPADDLPSVAATTVSGPALAVPTRRVSVGSASIPSGRLWPTAMDAAPLAVTGIVLDDSGAPVAGVSVVATVPERTPCCGRAAGMTWWFERMPREWTTPPPLTLGTTTTHDDGRFALRVPRHTHIVVRARHASHGSRSVLLRPHITRPQEVTLHLAPDFDYTLTVVDADGKPMVGGRCTLNGPPAYGVRHASTDVRGRVVWRALEPGDYSGWVADEHGVARRFHFYVPGRRSTGELQLLPGVEQPLVFEGLSAEQLRKGAHVVLDVETSLGPDDIIARARLDGEGRARWEALPPGEIEALYLLVEGEPVRRWKWGDVTLSAPAVSHPPDELRCRVCAPGALTGSVVYEGRAIDGARVALLRQLQGNALHDEWAEIQDEVATTRTHTDGTFLFSGVAPGQYAVVVQTQRPTLLIGASPSFLRQEGPALGTEVVSGATASCGKVSCSPAGRVEGRVVPCPWPDAVSALRIRDVAGSFVSEAALGPSGHFVFPAVPAGRDLRVATFASALHLEADTRVDAGSTATVTLRADPPAWVQGVVRSASGRPVEGALVYGWFRGTDRVWGGEETHHFGQHNGPGGVATSADGSYRVPLWPEDWPSPGRGTEAPLDWGVHVHHPDHGTGRVQTWEVTVGPEGFRMDMVMDPKPGDEVLIAGTVVTPDGAPAVDASVDLGQCPVRADANGRFLLRGTPKGEIRVEHISHRDGVWSPSMERDGDRYVLERRVSFAGWFIHPRSGEPLNADFFLIRAADAEALPTLESAVRAFPRLHPRMALTQAWIRHRDVLKKQALRHDGGVRFGFDAWRLAPGSYVLVFVPADSSAGGYLPTVAGPFDTTRTDLVVRAASGRVLSGVVTDEQGHPIRGAKAIAGYASPPKQKSYDTYRPNERTDGAGRFSLGGLTDADVALVVYKDGYLPRLVERGRFADGIEVVLQRGLTLRGTVVNEQSAPVRRCELALRHDDPAWLASEDRLMGLGGAPWLYDDGGALRPTAWTDEDGTFAIHGLPDLPVHLSVAGSDVHRVLPFAPVQPGRGPANLRVVRLRRLSGRLGLPPRRDRAAEDPDSWVVEVVVAGDPKSPYEPAGGLRSRESPGLDVHNLPPGPVTIHVWHIDQDEENEPPLVRVQAEAGDQDVVIRVPARPR